MKIKGITLGEIRDAANEAGDFRLDNVRQVGNYTFFTLRMRTGTPAICGHRTVTRVKELACTRPMGHDGKHWHRGPDKKIVTEWTFGAPTEAMIYRKRGIGQMMGYRRGPRYGTAVCFHGFKVFMDKVFDRNPAAIIRTAKAAYLGREDFDRKWPAVGTQNVGSQFCPVYYNECCDCGN